MIFERVKESVDIADVAERYGIRLNRHGKALCPFHAEKTPSFSVDRARQIYHCFGCGDGGDVIRLVQRIIGAHKPIDAVVSLNAAYGLGMDVGDSVDVTAAARRNRDKERVEAFEKWELNACKTWATYCRTLERWKADYAPASPEDKPDPRYIEACHKLDYADYIFHEIFINGSFTDRVRFWKTHGQEVKTIEQRIKGRESRRAG